MRCICCKGPFHPATGDYDRDHGIATCGACYRPVVAFVKSQMSRKWGRKGHYIRFYEHAATSIVAGRAP